jgi:TM2 domain-containing membrane protein YozV
MYCKNCGNQISPEAVICVKCGAAIRKMSSKNRTSYVLFAVFLGFFGIHNFYAGYSGKAIAQLLISLISFGALSPVSWLWAIIEACTVKQDAEGNSFE